MAPRRLVRIPESGWDIILENMAARREEVLHALSARYRREQLGPVTRERVSFSPSEDSICVAGDSIEVREGRNTYGVPLASCTTATVVGRHLALNWTLAAKDSAVLAVLVRQRKVTFDEPAVRAFGQVALRITQDVALSFSQRARAQGAEQLQPSGGLGDPVGSPPPPVKRPALPAAVNKAEPADSGPKTVQPAAVLPATPHGDRKSSHIAHATRGVSINARTIFVAIVALTLGRIVSGPIGAFMVLAVVATIAVANENTDAHLRADAWAAIAVWVATGVDLAMWFSVNEKPVASAIVEGLFATGLIVGLTSVAIYLYRPEGAALFNPRTQQRYQRVLIGLLVVMAIATLALASQQQPSCDPATEVCQPG